MRRILHEDLWLCDDCTVAYTGADVTIVDQDRAAAVEAGQARLNAIGWVVRCTAATYPGRACLKLDSPAACGCCGSHARGQRWEHIIVGDEELSDAEFARSKAGWDLAPGGGLVPRKP